MTFNWHEMSEGAFLRWILPAALSECVREEGFRERLSAATEKFTAVDLVLEINGIRVDGEILLKSMQRLMMHWAEREAERYVRQSPEWEMICETQDEIQRILKEAQRVIHSKYKDAGLIIRDDD